MGQTKMIGTGTVERGARAMHDIAMQPCCALCCVQLGWCSLDYAAGLTVLNST